MQFRKKSLRRRILVQRDLLTAQERERAAAMATERILEHPWWKQADVVLGFASYGSEISTDGILQETLHCGKKLFLPRVEGSEMTFYRITDLTELRIGFKGIREPQGDTERYAYPTQEQTFLLIPGVAFDAERYRMGYGKGFYDRFLSDKPELVKRSIAVGYRCQMVENVPHGDYDIRPAEVIVV